MERRAREGFLGAALSFLPRRLGCGFQALDRRQHSPVCSVTSCGARIVTALYERVANASVCIYGHALRQDSLSLSLCTAHPSICISRLPHAPLPRATNRVCSCGDGVIWQAVSLLLSHRQLVVRDFFCISSTLTLTCLHSSILIVIVILILIARSVIYTL